MLAEPRNIANQVGRTSASRRDAQSDVSGNDRLLPAGKGFGKAVTAGLCQSLSRHVDNIGLNVKADNTAAIALYEKLGFEIIDTYYELMVLSHPFK